MNSNSLLLLLAATLAISGITSLFGSDQSTRIVQYLYDGDGAKKKISITSFGGGPVIASLSISSKDGKKGVTGSISNEDFEKIWIGFSSLSDLKKGDITSSKAVVDTDTHHIFFTMEKSSSGTVNRSYGVLAADVGEDFKAWLFLFNPKEKGANKTIEPTPMLGSEQPSTGVAHL